MNGKARAARPGATAVVSADDARALLRLSVNAKQVRDYLPAPSYVVRLAWRLHELSKRLAPPQDARDPEWTEPLNRAVRLHLMDGRDDAELDRWECLTYEYPTNADWGEMAAMVQSYAARLLEELYKAGRFEGDEPC